MWIFHIACVSSNYIAKTPVTQNMPRNFLYTRSDALEKYKELLKRADIDGMQVEYSWKMLEKEKNNCDFSLLGISYEGEADFLLKLN